MSPRQQRAPVHRLTAVVGATAAALLAVAASVAHAADDPPYTLTREGFFYVGGKPTVVNGRTYMAGQMYVDVRIPAKQTQPYPIIMVHGGTRSATTFFGTPDGREGWAQYFVRQGYAVYVVDQPGRGRSGYLAESYGPWKVPDGDGGQRRYLSQAKYKLWPQAHLHTQWPGSGAPDDFTPSEPALADVRKARGRRYTRRNSQPRLKEPDAAARAARPEMVEAILDGRQPAGLQLMIC